MSENEKVVAHQVARIAVYDDYLSAPRIVDIQPTDTASYIEQIASHTYELAQKQGGSIPYTVIREVSENFIHAHFEEPTVSILDRGNTIRFADQGPGIANKDRAQLPGFTSATSEMKEYIRGVGSGLPIVKEYLKFQNGRLVIEDNIKEGTVITITVNNDAPAIQPVVYQETAQVNSDATQLGNGALNLDDRDYAVLYLAMDREKVGPTTLKNELDISISTGYRILERLGKKGLLKQVDGKRVLTEYGRQILNERD